MLVQSSVTNDDRLNKKMVYICTIKLCTPVWDWCFKEDFSAGVVSGGEAGGPGLLPQRPRCAAPQARCICEAPCFTAALQCDSQE